MADEGFSDSLDSAFAIVNGDNSVRYAEMNRGITPFFFTEELPDEAASEKAGTLRVRVWERVRLFTSGDPNSSPAHPVTEETKLRFAAAYAQWKATKKNDHIEGIPLKEWPIISRGFIMELNALNIRSVEDLANTSDQTIMRIVDGRAWREKAKAWLDTAKDARAAARYAAEAARLRDDNAELRATVAELAERVRALEPKKKEAATAA